MTTEQSWAKVASDARLALQLLGYSIPDCAPGGSDPWCGGSAAEHAAANLVALRAVALHQMQHLGVTTEFDQDITMHVLADLMADEL